MLATRLYNMTNDAGMKDMLSFLIARDTMHQQQWLAAIEDMGGLTASLPVPNSFPQEKEHQDVSYAFINCFVEGVAPAQGRWSEGPSMDGKGEFSLVPGAPMGEEPMLSRPRPSSGAQASRCSTGRQPNSHGRGRKGRRMRPLPLCALRARQDASGRRSLAQTSRMSCGRTSNA